MNTKSFTHLPTTSVAITGDQLARQWKTSAKRTRSTSSEPNYPRMLSEAAKLMVKSQKRLLKLAPRLFDREVVERAVRIRLFAFFEWVKVEAALRKCTGRPSPGSEKWDILGKAPDPIAAAEKWVRTEVAEEAWKALSPQQISVIRIEWKILTLAEAITDHALQDDRFRSSPDKLRLKHIVDFATASLDLGELCLRWTTPWDISRLELVTPSLAAASATPSQPHAHSGETSKVSATRSNKIVLLAGYLATLQANPAPLLSGAEHSPTQVAV